jgi:hypothetical protein
VSEALDEKTESEIQAEIQSVFRQITASVTFLPMLDGNCTFNVLVYADADSDVPLEWGDSDAKEIKNGEKVQLRSFSTSNHRVDTLVSYRYVVASRNIARATTNRSDLPIDNVGYSFLFSDFLRVCIFTSFSGWCTESARVSTFILSSIKYSSLTMPVA